MTVCLDVHGRVAVLRLDHPPHNILDRNHHDQLRDHTDHLTRRDDIHTVVVRGDRHLSAGADIDELLRLGPADLLRHICDLQAALTSVARLPQPVVAAVSGYALGAGCELALCADHRIAAHNAVLGQPEIRHGLIPGAGGTQRLSALVGPALAKDLIYTGRHVRATEAHRIGLVDEVVPAAELYPAALAWATRLSQAPPHALRAAKRAIDTTTSLNLTAGLARERLYFVGLFSDHPEAAARSCPQE
ncbi:enoyl-CoA hydratase [Streptomyces spiroverticillatus]|uniref:enoyl-CoA hydratase n=1 Tax=Streptomyces finlayi TaxID=67296 RepID=A0A918X980_9ACTN|nr:enoyl-CoA hydratase/isomerase family protein [Streptomyces finlayi]GHA49584.1 enoyl-CoA hydratase [Streptomyces spiroverticillatus]GHD19402.1 enoyl-CoA hydratase [Streptomyces finlayi]